MSALTADLPMPWATQQTWDYRVVSPDTWHAWSHDFTARVHGRTITCIRFGYSHGGLHGLGLTLDDGTEIRFVQGRWRTECEVHLVAPAAVSPPGTGGQT